MTTRQLTSGEDLQRYDAWVHAHPEGSLWQSLSWKTLQEARGREVKIYVDEEENQIRVSALVVIDRTKRGWNTWEIPRGPIWASGFGPAGKDR